MSRINKSKILKTFNFQIQDFFKKIMVIFPKEDHIKSVNKILETLCKYNPVKIIELWHYYIEIPYNTIIISGDFNYFENKNYSSDVKDLKGNAEYVLECYDKLRLSISKMDNEHKNMAMKYIQILTKLSKLYHI
tara:strand:- start:1938 stop:2339 length:402 start_codon:yes stop_codon:yes gene_type:complete